MTDRQHPLERLKDIQMLLQTLHDALHSGESDGEAHARTCFLAMQQLERFEQQLSEEEAQRQSRSERSPAIEISSSLAAKLLAVLCELSEGSSRAEERLSSLRSELSGSIPV